MLIYLLLILALLRPVVYSFSCYVCPGGNNTFDYNITLENVPTQLKNCSMDEPTVLCYIDITWQRNPTKTIIKSGVISYQRSLKYPLRTIDFGVYTREDLEYPEDKYVLTYSCFSDRCNQPTIVKFLLETLTWIDKLDELKSLLTSNETFDCGWCFSNSTSSAVTNNETDRQQCVTHATDTHVMKTVDASCYAPSRATNKLWHQVQFDLEDRTRSDHWNIYCQSPNCNSLDTLNQMYEKSTIDFNMLNKEI